MAFPFILPKEYSPDFSSPLRKPVAPLELDWENPLTAGLLYYFVWQDGQAIDLVKNRPVTLTTASIALKHDETNAYIDHSGRAQAESSYSPFDVITTGSLSFFCKFKQPSTSRQTLFCSRVGNAQSHIEIRLNSDANGNQNADDINIFIRDTGISGTVAQNVITGDWQTVLGMRDGGTHRIYVDGVDAASASRANDNLSGSPDFVFGGLPNTTTINYTGDRSLDIGWDRALSAAEAYSLDRNPYQLLKPQAPPLYLVPSAAPAGFEPQWARGSNVLIQGGLV